MVTWSGFAFVWQADNQWHAHVPVTIPLPSQVFLIVSLGPFRGPLPLSMYINVINESRRLLFTHNINSQRVLISPEDRVSLQSNTNWIRGNELWTVRHYVRFEVLTAVTMKNAVFWDVTPCVSFKNRRFGGTDRLNHQDDTNRWAIFLRSMLPLLVTANGVPSSLILSTL
jgi:hypothetical protein